jgi:hypothetical protein
MKIGADILRRLSALSLTGAGLAGVLEILADIQRDDEARLEKQRERSKRSRCKKLDAERDANVAVTPPQRDSARDTPLLTLLEEPVSSPTQAELERELFRRGRQVCGKASGGLIASLLKAKGHDVALARAVIETASTKNDPREYVAAATRSHANGHRRDEIAAAFDRLDARAAGLRGQGDFGELLDQRGPIIEGR